MEVIITQNSSPRLKPNSPKRVVEKFINMYGSSDICINCTTEMIEECCNKCGDGVCANEKCCMIFPDRHNTLFIICNNCIEIIDNKLYLLIDMGKLEPLKQKILESKTVTQMRMHSTY